MLMADNLLSLVAINKSIQQKKNIRKKNCLTYDTSLDWQLNQKLLSCIKHWTSIIYHVTYIFDVSSDELFLVMIRSKWLLTFKICYWKYISNISEKILLASFSYEQAFIT